MNHEKIIFTFSNRFMVPLIILDVLRLDSKITQNGSKDDVISDSL